MKPTANPASPVTLDCDAVIIGSGAGGASVADVLVGAGLNVIMLEEGKHVAPSQASPIAGTAFHDTWRSGGLTAAVGRPTIAYAEGSCVGGGTEINSAITQRVDADLLMQWQKFYRIDQFSAETLEPFYTRAESAVSSSLTVGPQGKATDILKQGGAALGWKTADLTRGQKDCRGANRCSFVCPNGAKQSMSVTLLPKAMSRGMQLFARTRVRQLVVENDRVVEVRAHAKGPDGRPVSMRIRAAMTFVCAGAIHTPTLLRRSGLRKNIGNTLRLHPTIKVAALFSEPVDAHLSRLPLAAVTEFMPEQRIGGSVFRPSLFGLSLADDWLLKSDLMPEWRNCGSYYGMIRPRGVGKVRALPGVHEPLVSFSLAREDWIALGQVLTRLGKVMFAAGARKVLPSISGHPGWTSPDQVLEFWDSPLPSAATNLMTIHLFSSCPPGEHPDSCAVDSYGRVRGLENLFVADASLIPEAPGANPQITIMALAFRVAEAALGQSTREHRRAAAKDRP